MGEPSTASVRAEAHLVKGDGRAARGQNFGVRDYGKFRAARFDAESARFAGHESRGEPIFAGH
jgi:hypothetical protein